MAITLNGNSNVSLLYSSGGRITGDFTNATLLSRAMFQTSTADSSTGIYALPSGTSTAASWQATNNADPTNASKVLIATNGTTDCQLVSGRNGSGTYLPLSFYTNGSQQMQLDTSGNLALGSGLSPSAWGSAWKAYQYQGGSIASPNGSNNLFIQNAYNNGTNYISLSTAQCAYYQQSNGLHIWTNSNNTNVTVGATWTPNQAMTLDASGNLGLGATSISALGTGYTTMAVQGTNGAGFRLYAGATEYGRVYADATAMVFQSVGVQPQVFYLNGSERVRIDSSGNLLVNTTSYALSNTNSLMLNPAGGTLYHQIASGGGSVLYAQYVYGGTAIGSISRNGTTSVNFNGNSVPPSDIRLKENLSAAPDALPVIDKLQVKSFDWKSEGGHQTYGVIAQEVLEIFPEFVSVPSNPDEMLGINQSAMVPFLVKAIQELTTRLEALEAK